MNGEWDNPCNSLLAYVDQNTMEKAFAIGNKDGVYDFMTIDEVKELVIYRDRWPFLNDFVANIKTNKQATRSSHPSIMILNQQKDFIMPDEFPYSSYKVLDKKFIEHFLKWAEIDASRLLEYKNVAWEIRLSTEKYNKPFGIIRLGFGTLPSTLKGYSNLLESFNESIFSLETFNENRVDASICIRDV